MRDDTPTSAPALRGDTKLVAALYSDCQVRGENGGIKRGVPLVALVVLVALVAAVPMGAVHDRSWTPRGGGGDGQGKGSEGGRGDEAGCGGCDWGGGLGEGCGVGRKCTLRARGDANTVAVAVEVGGDGATAKRCDCNMLGDGGIISVLVVCPWQPLPLLPGG